MSRDVSPSSDKVIAVIGATGQQGGAVVRALQAGGEFKVRALSRNPGEHRDLADEVVEADLDRPETLQAAFAGAYGVFLVTNYWEGGTNELKQATAAVVGPSGLEPEAALVTDSISRPQSVAAS